MPLFEADEGQVKARLLNMYMDTIETFRLLSKKVELYFDENSPQLKAAIDEYIEDFVDNTDGEERKHPEVLIYATDRVVLQRAGFYGAQLDLKERQVKEANNSLREAISQGTRSIFKIPFKDWTGKINNFLGSLDVTGVGEALKEIKDCLRDDLPEE